MRVRRWGLTKKRHGAGRHTRAACLCDIDGLRGDCRTSIRRCEMHSHSERA